jgi:hypothetical protein
MPSAGNMQIEAAQAAALRRIFMAQARLEDGRSKVQNLAKIQRQIHNVMELIKDGHGTGGMVTELRLSWWPATPQRQTT